MKSNCCNAPDKVYEPIGCLYSDMNRCPKCEEPCEFTGKESTKEIISKAIDENQAAMENLKNLMSQVHKYFIP